VLKDNLNNFSSAQGIDTNATINNKL